MTISGLNVFGTLTLKTGEKLELKDFDKDGDGTVTAEEWEAGIKEYKLDSLELSTVDKNADNIISDDEFLVIEQKSQIQDALTEVEQNIAKDFIGNYAKYAKECRNQLKEYALDFVNKYTGEVSEMAESFKSELPDKYEAIKTNIINNSPEYIKEQKEIQTKTTKSAVIDQIIANLGTTDKDAINTLGKLIEKEADAFIKNYTGENLAEDLLTHLTNYLENSEQSLMEDSINTYNSKTSSFGAYIDSNELQTLKDAAKELIKSALAKGISVTLGNTVIKNETGINSALAKFDNGDELKSAVDNFINSLSNEKLVDKTLREAAEKAFTDVKGTEYAVNQKLIDVTKIDGYGNGNGGFVSNKTIVQHYRTMAGRPVLQTNTQASVINQAKSAAEVMEGEARANAKTMLNQDGLKSQIKEQIKSMLEAKGIPFSKIETVFENIYANSITQTLSTEGVIKCSYTIDTSDKYSVTATITDDTVISEVLTAFINTFNSNIAAAINGNNTSNTDMDITDLDYTAAVTNDDGTVDTEAKEALETDGSIKYTRRSEAKNNANKMIDRMKPQLKAKAERMCEANGIEFDENVFTTMFNNAKATTVTVTPSLTRHYVAPRAMLETFAANFQKTYTEWVNSKK